MEANNVERLNITGAIRYQSNISSGVSKLIPGLRDGRPNFTVFINMDPETTGAANVIVAPFTEVAFNQFMQLAKDMINSDSTGKKDFTVDCKYPEYVDNKKTGNIITRAAVTFGRSDKGDYYLNVTAPDRPLVPFSISMDKKWHVIKSDNTDISDTTLVKKAIALAWIDVVEKAVSAGSASYNERMNIRKTER